MDNRMNNTAFSKRLRGNLLLLLASVIWGAAFVAQKSGGAAVGSLTFNGVRSFIGAAGLFVAIQVFDRIGLSKKPADKASRKTLWLGGTVCGVLLFAATNLQQLGLDFPDMTAGKAGFITALYIVLVPVMGLFAKKWISFLNWLGVALAVGGLYLLCGVTGGVGMGDVLVLLCAFAFTFQILAISHFAPLVDGVRLSCIQFLVVGILNLPLMFIFEQPNLGVMIENCVPLLYAGLLSSGVAYTLQIIGQRDTDPTTASILMSLESVFAALTGAILPPFERLSGPELIGCVLMFAAVVLAQLPPPKKKENVQ